MCWDISFNINNLGQHKWNIWTTPPPDYNDAKMARFCSFAPGGGGVQAHLWVTRAGNDEQSDPAGRSLVKRRLVSPLRFSISHSCSNVRLLVLIFNVILLKATILDSIKWNSQPPSPPKQEDARRAKRAILASLKWGGGGGRGVEKWPKCSIYFVQDCR